MSENSPNRGVVYMTAAALQEAREHVEGLVNAYPRSTPLKSALPAIARRIGVSARRVSAIWHREARNIYAAEMDALRAAVARHVQQDIARLEAELAVARLVADRADAPSVLAAQAAVDHAKKLLKGTQ